MLGLGQRKIDARASDCKPATKITADHCFVDAAGRTYGPAILLWPPGAWKALGIRPLDDPPEGKQGGRGLAR